MWDCITTYVILTALLGTVDCDNWMRRRLTRESSKCYAHLGCVNITKAWYYNNCRPVNLMPEERYVVNTKFLFLNPSRVAQNTLTFDIISSNPDSVNITKYDSKLPLIMLIHDFTSSGYTGWIKQLALVLFKIDQFNVISVDWQQGAQAPFDQAISNARLVALECEVLLRMLTLKFGLQIQRVHLIGHGIGAHIAAYIGKRIQQIGRITGLDPTGPKFECMPSCAKLTPADALFVDVLHTDGEGYYRQGTMQVMGSLDYYLNDGHHQPGCKTNKQYNNILRLKGCELPKGKVLPGCSHKRALKYFIEAVGSSQCQFIGFRSVSSEEFLKTSCINCRENIHVQCATISMEVLPSYMRQINAKLYLLTADKPPFCMNPYIVTFNLACDPKADLIVYGHFEMMMVEDNTNVRSNATFNNIAPRELHHGQNETFLAYGSSYRIDYIRMVSVKWIPKARPWCMGCNNNLYINNMTITAVKVASDGTPEVKNDMCPKMTVCNSSPVAIKYKFPLELQKCKCVRHTKI